VDVHDKLDEITGLVEEARAMPMSASALVNRAELLALLDELRDLLPEELHHADLLLSDRAAVVAQGRSEADALLAEARAEHDRLVEETEVVRSARSEAEQVRRRATEQATRLLGDADDYVDRKLGEFEVVIDKLGQQVRRGRAHLAERAPTDQGDQGAAGANGGLATDVTEPRPSAVEEPEPARPAPGAFDQEA
jgi:cell division septum initiation protein DivIVA